MDVDFEGGTDTGRRGRPWLRAILILVIGFVAGAIAMGYALTHWGTAARFLKTGDLRAPAPVAMVQAPPRLVMPPAALPNAAQAAIDARVAQLESRIRQIDARAEAAVGNADRAEGLLVAFAARRALDRGVALGYMETLLRDRFGGSQPQAVATIMNAAHQPVTLEALQAGLEAAAPGLMVRSARENWWQGLRRELSGLVVVRRADTPSPNPEDRLTRARNQLQAGNVEGALAEVSRMPGRAAAESWITLARRYVAARSALDMIETAALLTPQEAARPVDWPAAPEDQAAPAAPAAAPVTQP